MQCSILFDEEGNRIRQSLNDCLTTRFVYDGANVVAEMNASNEVIWAWINGPGLDQPVERIAFIHGTPRNRQVVHADGLGSVSALSDESGEPSQTYAYAAFGGIRARTGTDLNRVTFTAREALGDSLGFTYYRHRVYDPNTGRFTSEDPLGFIDGANRYVYCANNPVNFTDPFGEDIYYENTDAAAGLHRRVSVGQPDSKLRVAGISFGTATGGENSILSASGEPATGRKGTGIVYKDYKAPATKIIEQFPTTPEEDKYIAAQMPQEINKTGPYNRYVNNCREYSKEMYDKYVKMTQDRRKQCEACSK